MSAYKFSALDRSSDSDDLLAVDYPAFVPVLVEGVNEQGREIEVLSDRISQARRDSNVSNTGLEVKLESLTARVVELEEGVNNRGQDTALREDEVDFRHSFNRAKDVGQFDIRHSRNGGKDNEGRGLECGCTTPDPRIGLLELQVQDLQHMLADILGRE